MTGASVFTFGDKMSSSLLKVLLLANGRRNVLKQREIASESPIFLSGSLSNDKKLSKIGILNGSPAYGTPEGTFLFPYLPEKKSKQKELERKSKQ